MTKIRNDGCSRCGWFYRDHLPPKYRFACRSFEGPDSDYTIQLQKALALNERLRAA